MFIIYKQLQTADLNFHHLIFLFSIRLWFHQNRNKMFMMFQEGRQQAMCRYTNLFMHFSCSLADQLSTFLNSALAYKAGGSANQGHCSSDKMLGKQTNKQTDLCLNWTQLS